MRLSLQKIIEILDGTPAEYDKREGGQSVVELALVMPILLILLVGMIEIGWFTNNYLILLEASRVGAREGTKLDGDSSPYTWEEGTITLRIDNTSTPEDEGLDLDSIQGVAAPHWLTEQYDIIAGPPRSNEVRAPGEPGQPADPPTTDIQRTWGSVARGSVAEGDLACESLRLGFYTNVACATLDSMAPLDQTVTMIPNDELEFPDQNELPLPLNDIVVSVFSLNRIPSLDECSSLSEPGQSNCNSLVGPFRTGTQSAVGTYNSGIQTQISNLNALIAAETDPAVIAGYQQDISNLRGQQIDYAGAVEQAPRDSSGNPNAAATQVMVTGRFPSNANECASDWRDPFDLNADGEYDAFEIDDARLNVLNSGGILMDRAAEDFYEINGSSVGTSTEALRGFALTGKWRAVTSVNCSGSEWDIVRIERLVNLRGSEPTEIEAAELPERQGLVLVEIFWRHDLLMDFPLTGGILQMFGAGSANRGADGNDTGESYIKVWAAFPMATVNFNLDVGQQCAELLFLDGTDEEEYEDDSTTILECDAPSV